MNDAVTRMVYAGIEWADGRLPMLEDQIKTWGAGENIVIPGQYIEFLSKVNGGKPNRCVVAVPSVTNTLIKQFGAFTGCDTDPMGIECALKYFRFNHPLRDQYVPIAEDCGGNLFLLDCDAKRPSFGTVWFEVEDTEEVGQVARSFDEFLSKLKSK